MSTLSLLLLPLLLLCTSAFSSSPATACDPQDLKALSTFRAQLSSFNHSWWNHTQDCCSWQGVDCQFQRVWSLSLPSYGLMGGLTGLSSLTKLQFLNLSDNHIHGTAEELGSLTGLVSLDLSLNNLTGQTTFLAFLPSLQLVNISYNLFRGKLQFVNSSTSLQTFSAKHNFLEGQIDFSLCQYAHNVSILELSNNQFTEFGYGMGSCNQLQVLDVSNNNINGLIPADLFNLRSLTHLRLQDNNLTGMLDEDVGKLGNLKELILASNSLFGPIPRNLSNCRMLRVLILCNNKFSGLQNLDCEKLQSLIHLDLNSNAFTGPIPRTLGSCSGLQVLNMARNKLVGEIPEEFNGLHKLTTLSLSTNQLSGSLSSLANCTKLFSLVLTKNTFSGPFPPSIIGFTNLQVLALGYMNLKGTIPDWLRNCQKLQVLDLSWNSLSGTIPEWIGDFPHLFYLDLSNNSFTGSIPEHIFRLPTLIHGDQNYSSLQPVVSEMAIKRQKDSPDLQYTQVAAFPPSLYLSHNNLKGYIPEDVGNLTELMNLDLSFNNLNGNIPKTLGHATHLEYLDLSMNNLTGLIPSSLAGLTFLSVFNVSFNNLFGMIPQGNQFSTFTYESYEGNSELCGPPLQISCKSPGSRPIFYTSFHRSMRTRILIFTIAVGLGILIIILLMAALFWILSRRNVVYQGNDCSTDTEIPLSLSEVLNQPVEWFHSHEKFTVADLFLATNNFDSANIIGCGGFGLVYRADLVDGSRLAIKKLTGDCGQMEREFRAEVDALSKAQHKNLVSLQGFFHVGNDRLLIYSFMENGSLDYWLHERVDGGTRLDWLTRLKIIQGAARGLEYLHQICNPHIVHRDIKSSNILLDEKFEAHLADFGLARLMMSTDTHVTTELVGTLGYIPPEYSEALNATPRGDVYSFGVVILELLSRKRPVDVCKPRGAGDLVTRVQQFKNEGKPEEIFDGLLRNRGYDEQMLQVLDVACLCINRDPLKRPTIKNVVSWLDVIGQNNQSVK